MGFFTRRMPVIAPLTANQMLLESFLKLENTRIEKRADLEGKRDELEVRKLEIEIGALEHRTKAAIQLSQAREDLRQQRREFGRLGAKQKKLKMARQTLGGDSGCALCADKDRRDVSVEMVMAHRLHDGGNGSTTGLEPMPGPFTPGN